MCWAGALWHLAYARAAHRRSPNRVSCEGCTVQGVTEVWRPVCEGCSLHARETPNGKMQEASERRSRISMTRIRQRVFERRYRARCMTR